jgi:hypothetical protein
MPLSVAERKTAPGCVVEREREGGERGGGGRGRRLEHTEGTYLFRHLDIEMNRRLRAVDKVLGLVHALVVAVHARGVIRVDAHCVQPRRASVSDV